MCKHALVLPLTDAVSGCHVHRRGRWDPCFSHSRLVEVTSSPRSTCDGTNDSWTVPQVGCRHRCYHLSIAP